MKRDCSIDFFPNLAKNNDKGGNHDHEQQRNDLRYYMYCMSPAVTYMRNNQTLRDYQ